MAESPFYGVVRGKGETQASRIGDAQSGLTATLFSKTADFLVTMMRENGEDWILVSVRPHNATGADNLKCLYYGPVKDLLDANHLIVQIAQRAWAEQSQQERQDADAAK